ncbi:MAG: DUF4129 domain-containing protein [Jatrophihabitans sp.]|uniref:DUF4129 domain-containing protein n=1 Tax=Jatrophihabitans sp. TaxID=1932789 RepID=UPI00390D6533
MVIGVRTDAGPVGGDAAQRAARAELTHREYHRDDPGWVTRVARWVGRRLADLFTGTGGAHALLIVGIVAAVIVIVLAVRAGVPTRRGSIGDADGLDPLAPVAARDHRRIAAALTADGRRAEALREWLRAAVASIEERGILPPRPGRTGAATAREAGPLLPAVAMDLAAATRAFDEVWFGGREATDADVAAGRAAADGVLTARAAAGAGTPGIAIPW